MENGKDTNQMKPQIFTYNLNDVSKSLRLSVQQAESLFRDGRVLAWVMLPGLTNLRGDKDWRLRILTDQLNVSDSRDRGTGRVFHEEAFKTSLRLFKQIVVADSSTFPLVNYWVLPSSFFEKLWDQGVISHSTGSLSRKTFLQAVQLYNP